MEIGIFDVQIETFSRDLALAYVRRGYAQYRSGDLTSAMAEFIEARRLCPDDAYVHYLLGKTLLRFGRPREAQVEFKEVLRLSPTFIDAHYQLGKAYLSEPNPQVAKAQSAFEAEIAVYSSHAAAHHKLARLYRQSGLRDRAVAARRRAGVYGYRKSRSASLKAI